MTGTECIALAFENILSQLETPSAEMQDVGFRSLKELVNSFAVEGLIIPTYTWGNFPLVVGDASYTIGPSGADVTAIRPEAIEGAFIRDSSNYDHLVSILDEPGFRTISSKTTSYRPQQVWYDPGITTGTFQFYPVPSAVETFYYSHLAPLTEPTAVASDLGIPKTFGLMLALNLAIELAPKFNATIHPALAMRAKQTKDAARSKNAARQLEPARLDIPGQTTLQRLNYDILGT